MYCSFALVLGWKGKNTADKEKKSTVCFQPLLKQNDHAGSSASTPTLRTRTAELQCG